MTDDTGAPESIFIVEVDITEKKRMEAQLMQTQRLETLGLLAGGIAHDLNNVLAPIIASVDMLSTAVTEARDRELLETVEASAQHGADLVRQLLAFARGKGGQRGEIAVGSLVTGVKRLLRHAMPRDVEVRSNVPDGLSHIQCDATQIRQVLLNLCINARDAMPRGGLIDIRAEDVSVLPETRCLQGEAKPGPHVRISVADTGDGIPPHILEKIFDPFFTTKKTGKGTGLGLVNVVEIVKSHGGFLTLDTKPGEGTTFHIHLPATEHVNGHATNAGTSDVAEAPRISLKGSQESILIIEDDDAIREILKLILEAGGYHVATAEDGAEGLKLFREQPARFRVVITDFHMPGMSGLDVVRELRAMPVIPRIICLSGLASEMVDTPEAEGVECVGKPVSAEKLLGTVQRVLEV
jgi:nitrogen-specific signal transduction histidine kinase